MGMWASVIGLLPFFISMGAALAIAIAYKAVSGRRRRRSPLAGRKVGKLPGHELVERISDLEGDMMGGVMLMYIALPVSFMSWLGTKVSLSSIEWGWTETAFLIIGAMVFGWGMFTYISAHRRRENARDGLLAESVTGMQLNRLVRNDCIVMHDLPADGFNIDHVVISPRGVYAVETKSFRKPRNLKRGENYTVMFDGQALRFPDFVEQEAIAQARNQAQWLSRNLRESLKREVPVIPALSLPGWYVEQSDSTWRGALVKVFNPMGGGANFMGKDIQVVDEVTRNLVRDALAVRYPEIPA
jgi:hypothetical protein